MLDENILRLIRKKRRHALSHPLEDFSTSLNIDDNTAKQSFFKIDKQLNVKPMSAKTPAKSRKKLSSSDIVVANYLNMGYYLITPLLLGVFFGLVLDNLFKTKPFFVLLFIFLGLISTFYNLWRLVREIK